jgi:hypothetical protein
MSNRIVKISNDTAVFVLHGVACQRSGKIPTRTASVCMEKPDRDIPRSVTKETAREVSLRALRVPFVRRQPLLHFDVAGSPLGIGNGIQVNTRVHDD